MSDVERRLGFNPGIPELGFRRFVGVTAISVAAAALSWTVFERPINGLKDMFPYVSDRSGRRSQAPELSSQGASHQTRTVPASKWTVLK